MGRRFRRRRVSGLQQAQRLVARGAPAGRDTAPDLPSGNRTAHRGRYLRPASSRDEALAFPQRWDRLFHLPYVLSLHQFFRRHDHRWFETHLAAEPTDRTFHDAVCNVRTVPRQQKIHSIHNCDCNVRRVCACLRRQCGRAKNRRCQATRLIISFKNGKRLDVAQSLRGRAWIAAANFIENFYRHEQLERKTPTFPPVASDLLMCCRYDVPARSRCKVADHA